MAIFFHQIHTVQGPLLLGIPETKQYQIANTHLPDKLEETVVTLSYVVTSKKLSGFVYKLDFFSLLF